MKNYAFKIQFISDINIYISTKSKLDLINFKGINLYLPTSIHSQIKYYLSFVIRVHHQRTKPYPIRITVIFLSLCVEFDQFHMLVHTR